MNSSTAFFRIKAASRENIPAKPEKSYRIPVNKQILRVPAGIDINPIPFGRISDQDYRQSLLP